MIRIADDRVAFTGSVPENYDRYLAPFLFEPCARDLAARVRWGDGHRVLELACGTGRLTRHLAAGLTGGRRLLATDLNADMIAIAKEVVPPTDGLDWETADAGRLTFANETFETVVCQFGLMFVPDRAACLRECRRVLVPGGRLLMSVWDSLDQNPATAIVYRTVVTAFPDDPPLFFAMPHSMHDRDELALAADGAGFEHVAVDAVELPGESPSARDAASGFVLGSPLYGALRARAPERVEEIRDLVASSLAAALGDTPMRSPLRFLVLDAF